MEDTAIHTTKLYIELENGQLYRKSYILPVENLKKIHFTV